MPFGIAMWQFTSQAITCEYGLLAVTVTVFLSALSVQTATSAANAGPAATNAATAKSQIFMKVRSPCHRCPLSRRGGNGFEFSVAPAQRLRRHPEVRALASLEGRRCHKRASFEARRKGGAHLRMTLTQSHILLR